jgi:hypothetical protein
MENHPWIRDWWVPFTAAILVGIVGWFAYRDVERGLKSQLRENLQTILDADVAALRSWTRAQQAVAELKAGEPAIRRSVAALVAVAAASDAPRQNLLESPALASLRLNLNPLLVRYDYAGFGVINRNMQVIASLVDEPVGTLITAAGRPLFDRVLAGTTTLSTQFPSNIPLRDRRGAIRVGVPTMFVVAPVSTDEGEVIAALALRIRPEGDLSAILETARMGESGETYAFNRNGVLLSQSRFEDDLRAVGLLPKGEDQSAILRLELRDPGGNLLEGFTPASSAPRPLTRMAVDAVAGNSGVDVDGYRDYRGVPVLGAWTWLPEMEMGVATEVDVEEAHHSLVAVQRGVWSLLILLTLLAAALFLRSVAFSRLRRKVEVAQRLGQYDLQEKIAEGGMSKIYLARHALLRRATAVKVIKNSDASPETLARFEREVQFTSQLTHPNTIAIYDYGHTEEGLFYYAMEYLDGVTLAECVEATGPQSEGRVIHVMTQVAGSLAEAHHAGLIHRDLKPNNIMLCMRGGLFDFVKVLDFGLVRSIERPDEMEMTDARYLIGTPLYLSPELIRNQAVDPRSDVYQLGAVAYFLLTGEHVFGGETIFEVCQAHLKQQPEPPSARLGRAVANDLEDLILSCLSKGMDGRPASATALIEALGSCADAGKWGQRQAQEWWQARSGEVEAATHPREAVTARTKRPFMIDLEERQRPT